MRDDSDIPDFQDQHAAVEERVQSSSHEADEIVQTANEGGTAIGAEVRREALTALRKLVNRGMQPRELMKAFFREFRLILRRYEPFLAQTATDANLASFLKGGTTVIDALLRQARGGPDPFIRYLHNLGSDQPPNEPPYTLPFPAADEPAPIVKFPVIMEAARDLQARRVMSPAEFYAASARERLAGFTVSRTSALDSIEKIQEALIHAVADGDSLRTFTGRVEAAIDRSAISPAHLETVFRTGIMGAYARGMKSVLANDFVGRAFPFIRRRAIFDSRLTELCRTLSSSGLPMSKAAKGVAIVGEGHMAGNPLIVGGKKYYTGQPIHPERFAEATEEQRSQVILPGSSWYWRHDPAWILAGNPSHFGCRCSSTPASIKDAADAGVIVAQQWLASGNKPPDHMLCVTLPDLTQLEGYSAKWSSVWADSALVA